jgi:hypothetical protein
MLTSFVPLQNPTSHAALQLSEGPCRGKLAPPHPPPPFVLIGRAASFTPRPSPLTRRAHAGRPQAASGFLQLYPPRGAAAPGTPAGAASDDAALFARVLRAAHAAAAAVELSRSEPHRPSVCLSVAGAETPSPAAPRLMHRCSRSAASHAFTCARASPVSTSCAQPVATVGQKRGGE